MRITLPGFITLLGSREALRLRITAIPAGPCCSSTSRTLPLPIPCSPVQVPPTPIASFPSHVAISLTRSSSRVSPGFTRKLQWKFPSPTCPTMGATQPELVIRCLACSRTSAREERGTHTSVSSASHPGSRALAAYNAL